MKNFLENERDSYDQLEVLSRKVLKQIESQHGLTESQASLLAEQCEQLMPSSQNLEFSELQPFADDSAAALCYTLRYWATKDSREIIWASRCVYNLIEYFVQNITQSEDFSRTADSHPLVQSELVRQFQDLHDLKALEEYNWKKSILASLVDRSKRDAEVFFG